MSFISKSIYGLMLLGLGCTSNTILKKPKDLITKECMVALLTDLYLAKSFHEEEMHYLNKDYTNWGVHQWILEKHQIDSTQFNESSYYYASIMDDYEGIHKLVLARLRDTLKKIKIQDSISNFRNYQSMGNEYQSTNGDSLK